MAELPLCGLLPQAGSGWPPAFTSSHVPIPKVQQCCGLRRPCCSTSTSSPRNHFCAGTLLPPQTVFVGSPRGDCRHCRSPGHQPKLLTASSSHHIILSPAHQEGCSGAAPPWPRLHSECAGFTHMNAVCGLGGMGTGHLHEVAHMHF